MTGSNIKPQKGAPNAKWHISHATVTERGLDILTCPAGSAHDVGMEWATLNGVRTGRMVAWCWTCGHAIAAKPQPEPKHPNGRRPNYQRDYARQRRRSA